jgi:hypothetical protein
VVVVIDAGWVVLVADPEWVELPETSNGAGALPEYSSSPAVM